MKRKILISVLILMLMVSLAGCSTNSLTEYKKAVEKTEQIKKGQTLGEFSVMMDFNTAGMTAEQIRELNYFKDMKGSFSATYDDDSQKGIFRKYFNFGGLGFDFELFINEDEVFMKLPVIGKYMKIDEPQTSLNKEQKTNGKQAFISQETPDELSTVWLGLLTEEDVFKGRNIVITTPDGEVKSKEYTIKLSAEQIRSLAEEGIDILAKDIELAKSYENYIQKNVEDLRDKSLVDLLTDIKESMKDYTLENFMYTAYVDIDGYIVNETVNFTLKVENPEQAGLAGMNYRMDTRNWGINKEQQFDFPVLTEENTFDTDELDGSMPEMIEDLFNH